mgnify:CR=1 FL=1
MDSAWPFDDDAPAPQSKPPAAPQRVTLGAGVHQISGEEYHADPCPEASLSSTLAKIMLQQTPLHAWVASPRLNPDWEPRDSKTFDIGRAAHRAVLGAGGDYIAIPDDLLGAGGAASTKAAKAFIEDARAAGKTPLKSGEVARIETMAEKAHKHMRYLGEDLDPARSEMVAISQVDGIWCRAMLDNVPLDARKPIYDFKTCESAHPVAIQKAIATYGYDVQAEHYRQVWLAATGEERNFRFVFQEKTQPHEICVIELGADTLFMARKKIARAREMWRICLDRQEWPGYPLGVHAIDLPSWAITQWLERESVEEDHRRQHGTDILLAAMRMQAPYTEGNPE